MICSDCLINGSILCDSSLDILLLWIICIVFCYGNINYSCLLWYCILMIINYSFFSSSLASCHAFSIVLLPYFISISLPLLVKHLYSWYHQYDYCILLVSPSIERMASHGRSVTLKSLRSLKLFGDLKGNAWAHGRRARWHLNSW